MDHLFFSDEVRRLADQVHEFVDVVGPFIENIVRILGLAEVYNTLQTIDFCGNCLVDDQIGQELFSFLK